MPSNTLASLCRRHSGQEAWIFGKGPSLDNFDFETAGPVRICINESVFAVPSPAYFFAHDSCVFDSLMSRAKDVAALDEFKNCKLILPEELVDYAIKRGVPAENVYVYTKAWTSAHGPQWTALQLSPDYLAKKSLLFGHCGTLNSAVHFCSLINSSKIHLVGCDGGGGYARRLAGFIDLPPDQVGYPHIARSVLKQLRISGQSYIFHK